MLNLKDPKISFIISSDVDNLTSYLYSREYRLFDIKEFYNEKFENSILAFTDISNDEIRRDAIHILSNFGKDSIIVKYKNETSVKKVNENGSEYPMDIDFYNSDSDIKSYLIEGVSFSLIPQQLYYFPKNKEDFKAGMVVEMLSNKKWVEKKVVDPEKEFEKMYGLLIKYDKIRVAI